MHPETPPNNTRQSVLGKRNITKHLKTTPGITPQQVLESGSGPGGRWFKSTRPDHLFSTRYAINSRLQLQSLGYAKGTAQLLNLAYGYTGHANGGNNGQVTGITDSTDTAKAGRTVNYSYDAWARLWTAQYPQWGLRWDYDRYGNRTAQTVTHGTGPSNSVTVSTTTNRIAGAPYTYDANGNMTNDGLNSLGYDAENRVVSAAGATYNYDGTGLRVKKVSGGTTTVYIFSGARMIAEYANGSLSKEYVYSGGQLIATHDGATLKYHHADHLSMRVTTDTSGSVTAQSGHHPFGENWYESGGVNKLKFTSYDRDSESGNDYAIFRTNISRLGRFNRPDPIAGSPANPQSLNRYAYVNGDPVNLTDPLGLVDDGDFEGPSGWRTLWNYFYGNCTMDGGSGVPCSFASSFVASGAAAVCTLRDCTGIKYDDFGWYEQRAPDLDENRRLRDYVLIHCNEWACRLTPRGRFYVKFENPTDIYFRNDEGRIRYFASEIVRREGGAVEIAFWGTVTIGAAAFVMYTPAAFEAANMWAMANPDYAVWMMQFAQAAMMGGPIATDAQAGGYWVRLVREWLCKGQGLCWP